MTDTQQNHTPSKDQSAEGELENFIIAFNAFEVEAALFEHCKDDVGLLWWDYARYSVQMAIARERGYFAKAIAAPVSLFIRIFRLLKHFGCLFRLIWCVVTIARSKVDTLYVSTRFIEEAENQIEATGWRVIFINKTGVAKAPHTALSKIAIDFALRLMTPLISVPVEVQRDAETIAAQVKARFQTQANIKAIIMQKYQQARATYWLWKLILPRFKHLKRVLFVNDDLQRPLVALAHEQGLETIEVQHGYMGRAHFSFSYPSLSVKLPTMPEKVWITCDSGDIVYPVPRVMIQSKAIKANAGLRDIDVLIASIPGRTSETLAMVNALQDAGLQIAVKLHPAQMDDYEVFERAFSSQNVALYGKDDHFLALAQRSRIFIPASSTSTTALEAVEAGAALIVIHYNGLKVTSMCDKIASLALDSVDELKDAVITLLKEGRDESKLG